MESKLSRLKKKQATEEKQAAMKLKKEKQCRAKAEKKLIKEKEKSVGTKDELKSERKKREVAEKKVSLSMTYASCNLQLTNTTVTNNHQSFADFPENNH